MKRNDGAALEQVVALIEGRLTPHGFTVEPRTPVFNDRGVQIAEFDIVIRGSLGTSQISWLIECRDRPSDGPAPGEWIEQLIGRRARFHFDKVMAVSSTGFSPGAIEAAAQEGIELRSLNALMQNDVQAWLPLRPPIVIHQSRPSGARIFLGGEHGLNTGTQWEFDPNERLLISETSGEAFSIGELWTKIINGEEIWRGIDVGSPAKETTVNVLDYLSGQYLMGHCGKMLPVERLEIDATLQLIVPDIPLVQAGEYSSVVLDPEGRETFARIARWKGPDSGLIREMMIIGFLSDKEPGSS